MSNTVSLWDLLYIWWMYTVWVVLPMNTDACSVEDMHIPHITECLSPSCAGNGLCVCVCLCSFVFGCVWLCEQVLVCDSVCCLRCVVGCVVGFCACFFFEKKTTSVISKKNCLAREFVPITVLMNSKKLKPHWITVINVLINSKNNKICTTHFSNHFLANGISSRCVNKPMYRPFLTGLPVLTLVLLQSNKTPLSISWVSEPDGLLTLNKSHRSHSWILGFWLGLLWVFTTSRNFWTQFFHPVMFQGNLRKRSRWRIYILVFDFSRFHHDSLRDTISWECSVKDDCVRLRLIELQSFLLSQFDVNPIHRVLMFLPYFLLVPRRGTSRWITSGSLCSLFIGSTGVKNTVFFYSKFVLMVSILNSWWSECKLIAHPMWQMYSKKSFGFNSLSCNEGSMRLRPEWPWRAQRKRISCPDGSVQYWNLFLLPPPPAI